MFQNIPERSGYGLSCLVLLIGIFFCVYPALGILKNDLVVIVRPGGKAHHLYGPDALVIGIGITFLGLSIFLSAVKNILKEHQKRNNFYEIKKYNFLNQTIRVIQTSVICIMLIWSLYSAYIRLI